MADWRDQVSSTPPQSSPPSGGGDWRSQVVPAQEADPDSRAVDNLVKSSPYLKAAKNPYEGFLAGLQMSASVIPFHQPNMNVPQNASFATKLWSSIGQGAGDLPANIIGFFGGASAGAAAGAAVPGAGETGASEAVGGVLGGGFGTTATPQAVREVMMDYYAHKGDRAPMTASDFMHMVGKSVWNITKSGLIGAVGGAAGSKAASVVGDLGGSAMSQTAANLTAFTAGATGAQAALDQKLPDKEDMAIAAITSIAFAGAAHYAHENLPEGRRKKLAEGVRDNSAAVPDDGTLNDVADTYREIYRRTGILPWEASGMAKGDPVLHQEIFSKDVNGDPTLQKFYSQRPPELGEEEAQTEEPTTPGAPKPKTTADHVEELLPQIRALEGSGDFQVSPAGAVGRYQVMPGTARQYGFDPEKLIDPAYNEHVARTILADLTRKFKGDKEAVLVAYNAGPGAAYRFIRDGRVTTTLPWETQKYLEHAGFGGKGGEPPEPPVPPEEPPAPEPDENPHEVPSAREQDFSKLTDEMMVSRFQDAIGEEPSRPSTGGNIMRQWVSELESTRSIDQLLTKQGLQDPKKDLTFEDMMRQTYASDDRTNYMMMKGNIDPITLDAKDGPSLVDVLNKVREAGGNMDEFDAFRVAQRTLDLSKRGIDTGVFKGGLAEAGNIVQRENFQKYRAINEEMQTWKRGGLEYGRDSGLWTDERIAAMEAASSHVSLRRIMGDDKAFKTVMNGPRGLKVSNPLKAMEGSDRQIVKPLLADIDNMRQIIRMADRNRAIGHLLGGQAALTDAQRNTLGEMGFMQIGDNRIKAMLAEPGSSVFKPYSMTPEQEQAALPFANVSDKNLMGGNRFLYYRNGKAEVWEANDPDLAALIRGSENQGDATTISVFGHIINLDKILSTPAKLERAGIMGNLDTALTVPGKHQLTAWALDPLHPPPYITMVKGLHDVLTKGDAYWDLMRRGGLSGAITDMDMAKAVDKALDDQDVLTQTGALEKVWNSTTHPLTFAQQITEALTEAERVGYYKRATAAGMDPNKAAMMGRRAYLDFSEKAAGATANRLAKYVPFFRAAMLGVKYVRDGVQADPKGAFLRVTLGLVGAQMALYALNRQTDQYLDPKDRYTSLPQWERDQYYITPPINGVRYKLGRPYVIGPLVSVPLERMMEAEFEKNPHSYDNFLSDWVKDIVPTPIPAVIKPILEQRTNYNFFTGRPLISDRMKEYTPDMQYSENTSEVSKKVSALLGDHTGLGVANVSPVVLDDYVQSWSGTLGMSVLHALDAPLGKPAVEHDFTDNIFVRGFVTQNPRMGTEQIDDFYKDAEHFTALHKDAVQELKNGDRAAAEADATEVGRKASYVVKIEHALTVQHTALKALAQRKDMSLDEKRQLSERIYNDAWNVARFGSKMLTTGNVSSDEAEQLNQQMGSDIEAAQGNGEQ